MCLFFFFSKSPSVSFREAEIDLFPRQSGYLSTGYLSSSVQSSPHISALLVVNAKPITPGKLWLTFSSNSHAVQFHFISPIQPQQPTSEKQSTWELLFPVRVKGWNSNSHVDCCSDANVYLLRASASECRMKK